MNILEAARLGQGMGGSSAPMGITGSNMALRNLPVPQIGNTINAQSARLQEMDKIKYQEQMKENLRQQQFNALNSAMAEDRAFADQMALNEQTHQNQIALEGLRHDQNLKESALTDTLALAREKVRQENVLKATDYKIKAEKVARDLSIIENDKRYAGIAQQGKRILAEWANWNDPESPQGKRSYATNRMKDLFDQLILKIPGIEDIVNKAVKEGNTEFERSTPPKFGSPAFMEVAGRIINSSPEYQEQIDTIRKVVYQEVSEITRSREASLNNVIKTAGQLGFSMPDAGSPLRPSDPVVKAIRVPYENLPAIGDLSNETEGSGSKSKNTPTKTPARRKKVRGVRTGMTENPVDRSNKLAGTALSSILKLEELVPGVVPYRAVDP